MKKMKIKCLNCGKEKISFNDKLLEYGLTIEGFINTCVSCSVRQILNSPPYSTEYKKVAEKYVKKKR